MRQVALFLTLLALVGFGCASEPQKPADNATPPKPAEVKTAATSDDVTLMAEYIILTGLFRTHLELPMKDSAAMGQIAAQVDFSQPNASAALTRISVKYLHDVLDKAKIPIEQFALTAQTPAIKQAAETLAKRIQLVSNQYFRAMELLKDPATVGPSEMQQAGMLISGTNISLGEIDGIGKDAVQAAHRALGH